MIASARAYAKINLFLAVKGKRPDGYHELDTVMQSVSLYDEVKVQLTQGDIRVTCDKGELEGEENIAYKACKTYMEAAGKSSGANIHINKNIPVAAGLGGGSADAAAVLLLLNRLFGEPLSRDRLLSLAAKLGADVPFFILGGTATATGIGEILDPLNTPTLHFVLVKEGSKQSTGGMYALLDSLGAPVDDGLEAMVKAIRAESVSDIASSVFNSFEACWDIKNMTACFAPFKPLTSFLSGSGPTVCAMFESEQAARDCALSLQGRGMNAFYAHSVPVGIEM